MTVKTIVLGVVAVVLCGWMAALALWPRPVAQAVPVEKIGMAQAGMQGQLNYLRSEVDGLKHEVAEYSKLVKIYKHHVLRAKGRVLNEDQDIQNMMEVALHEDPVRP